jgi:hypothetical protein
MLSKNTRTRLISVNGKKRRAHRVIMERQIGRSLEINEEVHHKNHNPLDNNIDNLELITREYHIELHKREKQIYPDNKNCVVCKKLFAPNPRKRKRNKCCSPGCAMKMRIDGRRRQIAAVIMQAIKEIDKCITC